MFHVKLFLSILFLFPFLVFSQHSGVVRLESKAIPVLPKTVDSIATFITPFPESRNLTKTEVDWFYWTNYSRDNPKRFWDSVVQPLITAFPSISAQTAFGRSAPSDST